MPSPELSDLKKASDFTKSLVDQLHANGPLLVALAAASLATLILPNLPSRWKIILFALSVFFIVYLIVLAIFLGRPLRAARKHLKTLGVEEKRILRPFLLQDRRTAHLNMLHAPSASLIGKGILAPASSVFPALTAPVLIQPHIWKYLRRHPECVGLTTADIGTADYEDDSPWLTKP